MSTFRNIFLALILATMFALSSQAQTPYSSYVVVIATCADVTNYTTSKPIIFCTADNKFYYHNGSTWTSEIPSPTFLTKMNWPSVTALPGSPATGDVVVVTDDSAVGACDSSAGSARSLCRYNGSAWQSLGDGGSGSGITNSAGNNIVMKSDGTNAVASSITDDGTTVTIGGASTGILGLIDTDQSHYLNVTPGSNLTADRTLTVTTGDQNRTLDLTTGSPTVVSQATTYYVCPSSLVNCAYNGDGGQAATPSDSNACTTKALPCATIAGARDKFLLKPVHATVTIQLADTTGGTAYFPDAVEFSNYTQGQPSSTILEKALAARDDTYPTGYIWIRGNDTTPNNVNVTGAATAGGTVATKQSAFVARGSNLRVSSMKINYFRASDADTGAINCYGAHCYVEEINATSDHTGNDGSLVSGFFKSIIHLGDQFNVTNSSFVRANAGSQWQTYSPAGYASCNCAADSAVFMMFTNEQSHGFFQGGTWNFTGTGAYYAHAAWTNSSINWNADATTSITYNAANATGLYAAQGSKIWEGAGVNMTVTVTALSRRAQARSGSYVHYGGTTAATLADLADGESCIGNGTFPFVCKTTSPRTAFEDLNEVSAPATPAANAIRLYARDKGGISELFYKNDAGTERDLSAGAGASPSIGGTLTSGTAGSVLFSGSAVFAQDNTNFFYDDTNNVLKLGNPSSATNYRLQLKGSGSFDGLFMVNEGNSILMRQEVYSSTQTFHAPQFGTVRGRGTIASPAAVVSGDLLYQIDASGQETTTTQNTAARISITADGTPGTNDMPGRIELGTTADGAASPTTRVRIQANGLTSLYSGAAVASAATITPTGNSFHVTGTTNITSVSGTGVTAGTTITIIFDGALTFTDGSNLKLAGNFVTTADDTITLVYDGTNWYETARAVN
jgi:hypothetical protein